MVIQTWFVYDAHTAKFKILTPILFNHGCMDGFSGKALWESDFLSDFALDIRRL